MPVRFNCTEPAFEVSKLDQSVPPFFGADAETFEGISDGVYPIQSEIHVLSLVNGLRAKTHSHLLFHNGSSSGARLLEFSGDFTGLGFAPC